MAGAGLDNPPSRDGDRRAADRRVRQVSLDGPDRRVAERRSGRDRRAKGRTRLAP